MHKSKFFEELRMVVSQRGPGSGAPLPLRQQSLNYQLKAYQQRHQHRRISFTSSSSTSSTLASPSVLPPHSLPQDHYRPQLRRSSSEPSKAIKRCNELEVDVAHHPRLAKVSSTDNTPPLQRTDFDYINSLVMQERARMAADRGSAPSTCKCLSTVCW
jgi:hypothetical protein